MSEAIVLLNMGGPNDLSEVKLFLHNMFNDPRIISAPAPIRRLIAWMIVRSRVAEATENYRQLGGRSPIVGHTRALASRLEEAAGVPVHFAMRYTPPFSEEVLRTIQAYERIYAIPLYPHHSVTTTASSFDALFAAAKRLGIQKERIVTIDHYHLDPAYNDAILERIEEALAEEPAEGFDLIFSAHGLPQKVIERGDRYRTQIEEQVVYLKTRLKERGMEFARVHLAFQSRLGPIEWTRPYLDDTLKAIENRRVLLCPIAFTIDNSETEYELQKEYRQLAEELGFIDYRVAKAPNDHPRFVEALAGLYRKMRT